MKIQRYGLIGLVVLLVITATTNQTVYAETRIDDSIVRNSEVETEYCDGNDVDEETSESLIYDDGVYESGHGATTIVSQFTPPSYPFHFTHGCICWVSEVSSTDLDFEVVMYEDTGDGPGAFLAGFSYHAEALSRWLTTTSIYQVPINYVLNSGSVYIGATKTSDGEAYLCGDQSSSTSQQAIFESDSRGRTHEWQAISRPYRAMSIRAEGELPRSTYSLADNWVNSSPGDPSLPVAIYPGSIEVFAIDPNTGEGILSVRVNDEQIELAGVPSASQGTVLLAASKHPSTDQRIEVYRLATGEFQLNTWHWDGTPYRVTWSIEDDTSSPSREE